MPDLAEIIWHLDQFAGHWLPDADLSAIADWMDENRMRRATAEHPVDVRDGQITYGADHSGPTVHSPHRDIRTTTVPLRTPPPAVWQPQCDAKTLRSVQDVIAQHEWSSGAGGGSCVNCSPTWVDDLGRIMCRREESVSWPCPPVRRALAQAGMPVPPPPADQPIRLLGDCLDPIDNAMLFGCDVATTS